MDLLFGQDHGPDLDLLRECRISRTLPANLDWTLSTPRLVASVMVEGKRPSVRMLESTKGNGSFVEFETSPDLKTAVEKLNNREFKGATVHCAADVRFNPDLVMKHLN